MRWVLAAAAAERVFVLVENGEAVLSSQAGAGLAAVGEYWAEDASGFARFDGTAKDVAAGPFALGVAEGYLTCESITDLWSYYPQAMFGGANAATEKPVKAWLAENLAFTRAMATTDPRVLSWVEQFDGLVAGYQKSKCAKQTPLDALDLFLLNADGDLDDLRPMFLGPKPKGHCSAVFRLLGDELVFGHTTWDEYAMAHPRVRKQYAYETPDGVVEVAFSSTAGWLSSTDDFYLVHRAGTDGTRRLGVLETSLEVKDKAAYAKVTPRSLLSFVRSFLANRFASSPAEWRDLFALKHSGTYNSGWVVAALAGPLEVLLVEEMPGLVHATDLLPRLRRDKWFAFFNIPLSAEVQAVGGYAEPNKTAEEVFVDDPTKRAQIFAQLAPLANSVEDVKQLLRWNAATDPEFVGLTGGNPCNAIACRADLAAAPQDFGGIDAKVSSTALAVDLAFWQVAGPSVGNGTLPAFCWPAADRPRGHPACFKNHFVLGAREAAAGVVVV